METRASNWEALNGILAATCVLMAGVAATGATAHAAEGPTMNPYARWANGPPSDPAYFPIAVWLQDPKMAPRYREAGVNVYVALWRGPTEEQLATLRDAGVSVVCAQNALALRHLDDPVIVGWMHGDEPDNAQSLGRGRGYGPPIPPARTVADYEAIKARDPSRPILLNLGQGVAWDGWHGRGVRTNHPEDYPEYVKGCDIASFDIYPVAHGHPAVSGNLWYVAHGVRRLREWIRGDQICWNCIECTRIHSDAKATPHQVRAEVWMSLIYGSMGLIYFVHEWNPRFTELALLDDPEMLRAVTGINRQIHELAPVLNSPTVGDGVSAGSSNADVPIAAMTKRHEGATYVFSVAMRDGQTTGTFVVPDAPAAAMAEVLGEERRIPVRNGQFEDTFAPYDVHLYRIQ